MRPKTLDEDQSTVTFRMNRALVKRLKLAAVNEEKSQQALIVQAVEEFLDRLEKPAKRGR
jgi:predicted transcriptional regulator